MVQTPVSQGQHERAVEYFRRALRLSRGYQSAWTLMGHEFVEMKNAPAAIGASAMQLFAAAVCLYVCALALACWGALEKLDQWRLELLVPCCRIRCMTNAVSPAAFVVTRSRCVPPGH
jgi:hypothetical protein